jgi:predicted nucleic-acid-binding Zn-ribbon protein
MRYTQTCPKCGGHQFAVKDEFRLPSRASNATVPFPAVTIDRHGEVDDDTIKSGRFEAWICLGCGYTEFYAHEIEDLKALAKQHPDQLRIVDARPPEQGPYR